MTLIGIPGGDSQDEYRHFVAKHGLEDIPMAANADGDLWVRYGVSSQPRWLLIRADRSVERGGGTPPADIIQDALTPA